MISKILVLSTLFIAGTAFGQCPLSFDESDQAIVGAYIAPVDSGAAIVDYNSSKLMTPASVMKAVTTAAVLAKYGGDFQWQTPIMAIGRKHAGRLDGDIVINGSGDPTIESKHFTGHKSFIATILEGVKAASIESISGKVLLDERWPDEGAVQSWELEDIPGIDGAGFYALNFKDNIFYLSYPSLVTKPYIPGLNIIEAGGKERLRAYRNYGSNELTITGQLGRKDKKATLICSMPDPTEVALYHISDTLRVRGNETAGVGDTVVIATHKSPKLRDVTKSYMFRSDNQMAEAALRLMSPEKSRADALRELRMCLAKCGANIINANINDGSGLSRHNTISPLQLGSVLRQMSSNSDYVASFPRVGKDGTVKNFMKDMEGRENFVLKSGSMTGVVAYAGYRLDPETQEPTHVIAVIVNNAPYSSKARLAIAELLSGLNFGE